MCAELSGKPGASRRRGQATLGRGLCSISCQRARAVAVCHPQTGLRRTPGAGSEFQALSAIALPHTSHRRDADSSGATMVAVMRSLYQLIRMLLYPGHGSMLTAPPGSVAGA